MEPLREPGGDREIPWKEFALEDVLSSAEPTRTESTFLPRIAGQTFLEGRDLPLKRDMVPLFVDMVGSTRLVFEHSAEEVLEIMQAFMEVVVDIGAYHCGDVKDFEGDGALLYFEGVGEAVPAAFRLRDELLRRRRHLPLLPLPRLSLDAGPLVIGIVGTRFRQAVSLVGPSVHIAARLLKLAPPGGIIATSVVVEGARRTNPDFARRFVDAAQTDALEQEVGRIRAWIAPADGPDSSG